MGFGAGWEVQFDPLSEPLASCLLKPAETGGPNA